MQVLAQCSHCPRDLALYPELAVQKSRCQPWNIHSLHIQDHCSEMRHCPTSTYSTIQAPWPAPSQSSGGSSVWAETFSARNTALSRAVIEKETALVLTAATQDYLIPPLLHCRVTVVVLWCAKITMLPSSGSLVWPAGEKAVQEQTSLESTPPFSTSMTGSWSR